MCHTNLDPGGAPQSMLKAEACWITGYDGDDEDGDGDGGGDGDVM